MVKRLYCGDSKGKRKRDRKGQVSSPAPYWQTQQGPSWQSRTLAAEAQAPGPGIGGCGEPQLNTQHLSLVSAGPFAVHTHTHTQKAAVSAEAGAGVRRAQWPWVRPHPQEARLSGPLRGGSLGNILDAAVTWLPGANI